MTLAVAMAAAGCRVLKFVVVRAVHVKALS
ncbi:hypothetical protein J2X90_005050 [Variovorax paradoxus]|nr:hypothetical protein [Variovorax paradoxus]MDQ0027220.1 hypothetical protein [Variovorax paradoxus]